MALTMSVTYRTGITAPTAYIRISTFSGTKDAINFKLDTYYNQASYTGGDDPLISATYAFLPTANETKNFIRQAYEYLKTLTAYSSATDVLETGQTT